MEEKVGVFICTGYGIGEALDIDALKKVAEGEFKVPFCKTLESCEGADLEAINKDIKDEGLTKVVIAGISPRCFAQGDFPEGVIVEPVAIREMVVWTQPAGEEDTQMMAEDYLRMYITKVQKMEHCVPFMPEGEIDKSILVVGGGIAGMTAAIESAKAGYEVKLVEKEAKLGGWMAKQHKIVPTKPPYRDLEDTGIDELVAEIESNSKIKLYTSAVTSEIKGAPGLFDVTLKSTGNGKPAGEEIETFRVGSIIQATGWKPKKPSNILGYGEIEDVIRNVDLEEMVKEKGKITRPSDGREAKSVAFIQCGGSKEKEHHSYCSSICCLTSLKQAMYLREQSSECKSIYILRIYQNPRTV